MSFSDADLITRVLLNDDRHAFGELVRRYQSAVRGMLRKLTSGDDSLADDLSQDTFIQAYRKLSKYKGHAKFSTWLYRIAYNLFISDIRRKRELISFDENPIESSVPAVTDQIELKQDLEMAMKQLTVNECAAIHLCYQEGLSHEEAARVLDCPLGTVKTHILRGKNKLREILSVWRKGT